MGGVVALGGFEPAAASLGAVEPSSKIRRPRSVALFGFDAVGVLFEVGRELSGLLGRQR